MVVYHYHAFFLEENMGTTAAEIQNSLITRIAGQAETQALDVLEELGKNRAYVSSVATLSDCVVGNKTVSTSQVALQIGVSNFANRQGLEVQNLGTAPIYVGPTGVAASSGIKIGPETSRWFAFKDSFTLYAIAASGSHDVRVMEVS
jgi:hypothetical protein